MKKLLALMLLALFVFASVGCKNGLIAKWRRRGAPCTQCNTAAIAAPATVASSPCDSGMCSSAVSSPYISNSPMVVGPGIDAGSGYQMGPNMAPSSESGYFGSPYGTLPEPPGPIN